MDGINTDAFDTGIKKWIYGLLPRFWNIRKSAEKMAARRTETSEYPLSVADWD